MLNLIFLIYLNHVCSSQSLCQPIRQYYRSNTRTNDTHFMAYNQISRSDSKFNSSIATKVKWNRKSCTDAELKYYIVANVCWMVHNSPVLLDHKYSLVFDHLPRITTCPSLFSPKTRCNASIIILLVNCKMFGFG